MKHLFENWRKYLADDLEGQRQVATDLQDPQFYKYRDPSVWTGSRLEPSDERSFTKGAGSYFDLGRTLKKVFAKNADRKFIDSLVTLHYVRSYNEALDLLKNWKKSSRDELSASAYLPNQSRFDMAGSTFGGTQIAIEIKGHISLLAASMGDLVTWGKRQLRSQFSSERTKQSGLNKGIAPSRFARSKFLEPEDKSTGSLILDKEDYIERSAPNKGQDVNEALVDNWMPVGLYFMGNWGMAGPDCEGEREEVVKMIERMKKRGQLPKNFTVGFKEKCK